jgi:hypothetical protein
MVLFNQMKKIRPVELQQNEQALVYAHTIHRSAAATD